MTPRSPEYKIIGQPGSPRNLVRVFISSAFVKVVFVTRALGSWLLKASSWFSDGEEGIDPTKMLRQLFSSLLNALIDGWFV